MPRHYAPPSVVKRGHPLLPPPEAYEAQIEREKGFAAHWAWHGAFDETNNAVFRWPQGEGLSSVYTLVRVLLAQQGKLKPGWSVFNACGYEACINPDHWTVQTASERGRERLGYQVVSAFDATPFVLQRSEGTAKPRKKKKRTMYLDCPWCGKRSGCSCAKRARMGIDRDDIVRDATDDASAGVGAAVYDRETPRCETCWALQGQYCNILRHMEKGKPVVYAPPEEDEVPPPPPPPKPIDVQSPEWMEGRCTVCLELGECNLKMHRRFFLHHSDAQNIPPLVGRGDGRGPGRSCRCPICGELTGREHDLPVHALFQRNHPLIAYQL